nr:hypothetical protein [Tanacetum cinerariifolium]
MTSFGYRFNPRYAIKECSSCGTFYTRDCVCSIGTVEDKILIPKPPKNCARCTRCGYLVDGPNCQGCALLRQELEENRVTYSPDFQNSFEPSNVSTNVVNAPREPYVVKQDNGSFVDKIIFDFNRAPDSPNQFHCFRCKDVLRYGEACKRYTCTKCGSGLGKGLCYICGHNQNSLNDSLSIFKTSSQSPPNINHCCYECGDPLDGIFCKRCTCKSCGKDAHIGYNCPSKVLVISNPKPCNNQTINELPQTLPIFHLTFHSEAESPFALDSTPTYVDESPNPCYNQDFIFPQHFQDVPQQYTCCDDCRVTHDAYQCQPINEVYYYGQNSCYDSTSIGFDQSQPPQSPVIHQPPQELSIQEMEDLKQQYLDKLQRLSNLEYRDEIKIAELKENFNGMGIKIRKKENLLQEEQWACLSTHPSKRLTSFCFDDDDDDDEDYTSVITPDEPVLSTEEPDNSLSMRDEHLDTIPAMESKEFIKSSVENLIPIPSESEGIPKHVCDVPSHDNSPPLDVLKDQFEDLSESNEEFSSTDDDSFSFDKIDYVEASPPDFELFSSEVMGIVIPEVGGIKASNDNPIPFYDPVISGTPPNLIPSRESDFFLEGDMCLFEAFLNDDHSYNFKTKSSSTSLNSLLKETNNFDNSLHEFTTFSKVLFDADYKSDSSDDQTSSDEDVLEKIIDSPLDEFAGELTLLKLIPLGIDETDYDFEEDIRLIEKLLYDNSSSRPSKEFVSANSDAKIKSFSPSPILVKDSDSLMEEIDLFWPSVTCRFEWVYVCAWLRFVTRNKESDEYGFDWERLKKAQEKDKIGSKTGSVAKPGKVRSNYSG